ncbi:MmyB family transcriptional regulator [Nonomuraea rubra]
MRLLANLTDTPALVLGRPLGILSRDRLGAALSGDLAAIPPDHRNHVRMFGHSTVQHPITGPVSLDRQILASVDEQAVVLITAPPGSADHAALRQPDSWAMERSLLPSQPQAAQDVIRVGLCERRRGTKNQRWAI